MYAFDHLDTIMLWYSMYTTPIASYTPDYDSEMYYAAAQAGGPGFDSRWLPCDFLFRQLILLFV